MPWISSVKAKASPDHNSSDASRVALQLGTREHNMSACKKEGEEYHPLDLFIPGAPIIRNCSLHIQKWKLVSTLTQIVSLSGPCIHNFGRPVPGQPLTCSVAHNAGLTEGPKIIDMDSTDGAIRAALDLLVECSAPDPRAQAEDTLAICPSESIDALSKSRPLHPGARRRSQDSLERLQDSHSFWESAAQSRKGGPTLL